MKTVLLLIGFMIAPSHLAEAQQPTKMFRIGYLAAFDSTFESTRAEAIRLALRELGYVEGQNIAIAYRYADGKNDRRPELLADLVRRKVDIIVVAGRAGLVRAAKNVTATIPIVMVGGGADPVEARVITSPCPARWKCHWRYSHFGRVKRKAPGAVQRSYSQTCSCRSSL